MQDCIPYLITEEQKKVMDKTPPKEKLKDEVFSLNSDFACGLDSFSGIFFQSYWRSSRKILSG